MKKSLGGGRLGCVIGPKLIAMRRDGPIPLSNFDHIELGNDYFLDYPLTTAEHLTSTLKMTSTMGEYFAKKFYLYTRKAFVCHPFLL